MTSTTDNIKLNGITEEFIDPQGDRSVLLRTIALIDNNGLPISSTNPLYVTGAGGGSSSTSSVQGLETAGSAVTGGGLRIMGSDGTLARDIKTDTTGSVFTYVTNGGFVVTGNSASGATDSGNPIKLGGVYNSSLPTFTTGQRGDLQITPKGSILTTLTDANGTQLSNQTSGDGVNTYSPLLNTLSWGLVVATNGSGDRIRSTSAANGSTGSGVLASGIMGYDSMNSVYRRAAVDSNGGIIAGAGENHLGEIGGNVGKFQAQFGPASSTTYTTGQCMSAAIQVTGMGRVANGSGLITSATLEMLVANSVEVDLVFFSAAPIGTYTAGSAFSVAAADRVKVSKVIKIIDWTLLGTADSVGEPIPAPKFYKCDDTINTTSLWVVPVARGSITLASTTDATLTIRSSRN